MKYRDGTTVQLGDQVVGYAPHGELWNGMVFKLHPDSKSPAISILIIGIDSVHGETPGIIYCFDDKHADSVSAYAKAFLTARYADPTLMYNCKSLMGMTLKRKCKCS